MRKDSRRFRFALFQGQSLERDLANRSDQHKEEGKRKGNLISSRLDGDKAIHESFFIEFCNPYFMVLSSIKDPNELFISDVSSREYNANRFPCLVSCAIIKIFADNGPWTHPLDCEGGHCRKCIGTHEIMGNIFPCRVFG